jgi:hypothetical protein
MLAAMVSAAAQSQDPALVEWSFTMPENARGWTSNSHVSGVEVRDGALAGRATGSDPILLSPWIEIRTDALQRVEIRMKSDRGGMAQLFWAQAKSGRYGGFESKLYKNFRVYGDGAFHDYTIAPLWSGAPTVYRLRIDIPDQAAVAIASVRVVGVAAPMGPPATPRWEFATEGEREGWRALERGATLAAAGGSLTIRSAEAVTLLAPAAAFSATQTEWIATRIRARSTLPFAVWWTASGCRGVNRQSAALVGDGQFHTYNLNVGGAPCWAAGVDRFGLELPAGEGYDIDWVRAGALPDGEPDLALESLSAVRAINRAGAPFEVAGSAVNRGGRAASGVRARIRAPEGVKVLSEPPVIETLPFGEPRRLIWRLVAQRPMTVRIAARLETDGAASPETEAVAPVTAAPQVAPADYPPEPQPPATPYEIGAYYYPGWWAASRWDPIRRFPERTPVLGFYKEGDPRVVDWHIKYAVEHGIRFFAVDWYWRDGKEHLDHLYDGLFAARYQRYLKFCFLYANHDPFNVHDRAEWLTVTRYWIERYFRRDGFYKVDGKPVIVMFSPAKLRAVLGATAAVKEALDASRRLAREAGLPGVYFMGCTGPDVVELKRLRDEGYDAATAYNYPTAGAEGDNRAPYSKMVDAFARYWDTIRGAGVIDYVLPVSPGWDPRPWHGEDTTARPGNTPAEFCRMLELARQRMDPNGPITRRMLLVEAWNEWGEGSTCEPELRYGFGQADAIRDVFTAGGPHVDLAPQDLGLPLIEWEAPPPVTKWSFDAATGLGGWTGSQLGGLKVEGASLVGRSTGAHPILNSPAFRVEARPYQKVTVRIGASADTTAQLYWQTAEAAGMSELRSVRFPVRAGEARDYTVMVKSNPHWRGAITRWRLNPADKTGVGIQFEGIEVTR